MTLTRRVLSEGFLLALYLPKKRLVKNLSLCSDLPKVLSTEKPLWGKYWWRKPFALNVLLQTGIWSNSSIWSAWVRWYPSVFLSSTSNHGQIYVCTENTQKTKQKIWFKKKKRGPHKSSWYSSLISYDKCIGLREVETHPSSSTEFSLCSACTKTQPLQLPYFSKTGLFDRMDYTSYYFHPLCKLD
jgi:hypothetical protein